jgi:hypothetical protein
MESIENFTNHLSPVVETTIQQGMMSTEIGNSICWIIYIMHWVLSNFVRMCWCGRWEKLEFC